MVKVWFNYGYWCFIYVEGFYNLEGVVIKSFCSFLNLIDGEICVNNSEFIFEEVVSICFIVFRVVIGLSSDILN